MIALLQAAAASVMLYAFALVVLGRMTAHSRTFLTLNVAGASAAVALSAIDGPVVPVGLYGAWLLISGRALLRAH